MENKQKSGAKKRWCCSSTICSKRASSEACSCLAFERKKFVVVLCAFHELLGKAKGCIQGVSVCVLFSVRAKNLGLYSCNEILGLFQKIALAIFLVIRSDRVTLNLGFGFWRCHGRMGLNQVQYSFSSFFATFSPYLMIFQ